MTYVNVTLQTSQNDMQEALLYSPQKQSLLSMRKETRTPIKLQNYAYTEDKKKIILNDMTFISTPDPSEYDFQYQDDLQESRISREPTPILNGIKPQQRVRHTYSKSQSHSNQGNNYRWYQ